MNKCLQIESCYSIVISQGIGQHFQPLKMFWSRFTTKVNSTPDYAALVRTEYGPDCRESDRGALATDVPNDVRILSSCFSENINVDV